MESSVTVSRPSPHQSELNHKFSKQRCGGELVDKARRMFLERVQVIAPQVLKDLRDNVLPVYAAEYRAALERQALRKLRYLLGDFISDEKLASLKAQLVAKQQRDGVRGPGLAMLEWSATLRKLLRSWARTHHLVTGRWPPDWIVRNAESTLLSWASHERKDDVPLVWWLKGEDTTEANHSSMPEENHFDAAVKFQCGGIGVSQLVTKKHNRELAEQWIKQVLDLVGLERRHGDGCE